VRPSFDPTKFTTFQRGDGGRESEAIPNQDRRMLTNCAKLLKAVLDNHDVRWVVLDWTVVHSVQLMRNLGQNADLKGLRKGKAGVPT